MNKDEIKKAFMDKVPVTADLRVSLDIVKMNYPNINALIYRRHGDAIIVQAECIDEHGLCTVYAPEAIRERASNE